MFDNFLSEMRNQSVVQRSCDSSLLSSLSAHWLSFSCWTGTVQTLTNVNLWDPHPSRQLCQSYVNSQSYQSIQGGTALAIPFFALFLFVIIIIIVMLGLRRESFKPGVSSIAVGRVSSFAICILYNVLFVQHRWSRELKTDKRHFVRFS